MVISNSTYQPDLPFRSKHFNTVFRTLFHRLDVSYHRTRLELQDGDFMDLDFNYTGSKKLVIILHGLEGSSRSRYMEAMTMILTDGHLDSVSVNFRGCSGEPNRLLHAYHSGKTEDLAAVLAHIEKEHDYEDYFLIGYSMGGNMVLKYLGEDRDRPSRIRAGVGVSVPCDLEGSVEAISRFWNMVYMQRFLISLKKKTRDKARMFPDAPLDLKAIYASKDFYDFDNHFTAPVNGFKDASEYWARSSCKQFLKGIEVPTLLITASDDPFLSESCIPFEEAKDHRSFDLELTKYGGHVGYMSSLGNGGGFWLEKRIVGFFKEQMTA